VIVITYRARGLPI